MNYYISILFRAIPLLMGIICLTYGSYIYTLGDRFGNGYIIASHVIIFFYCHMYSFIYYSSNNNKTINK